MENGAIDVAEYDKQYWEFMIICIDLQKLIFDYLFDFIFIRLIYVNEHPWTLGHNDD